MDRIPVAFVGLGRIASLLEDDPLREKPASHAGAFSATGDALLVGGYDIDPARRRLFEERWNVPVFQDVDAMLKGTAPSVLVVATHPDSHERYVRLAATHGIPVAVCEKPLAHTRASSRRIRVLERRGGIRVVVNHERRFSADYRMVRDAIAARRYGRLLAVRATLHFGRSARHDQVLLHDGTHLVDAIHFVTGERIRLSRVWGRMRSRRSSVYLLGRLRQGGAPVTIEIGSERDHLVFELELSFERGRVRVGNGVFETARSVASPFYSGYRSLMDGRRFPPEPTGYFLEMAREALRLARGDGARSVSSAADAEAAIAVIRRARGMR